VTLIVGGVAAAGVIVSWQQKNHADKRSEWWRRTQWAFECALSSEGPRAELGWKLLRTLVASRLATRDDSDIVQLMAEHALAAEAEAGDGNDGESG